MTREEFGAILAEEGVSPADIEECWIRRPSDDLDTERLRLAARAAASLLIRRAARVVDDLSAGKNGDA